MATAPSPAGMPPDPPGAARGPAVLLVGHGSGRTGASAEPVLRLAEGLRARGFAEVRAAFWKEEPFLHQALDTLRGQAVVVLPVFLAEGYFTRTVVPRELGLEYGDNHAGGRAVRLLPPLGASPALDDLVLDRARAALGGARALAGARLILLGHGTPRDPGSGLAVLAACDRLAARGLAAHVVPAFIDQEPGVEAVVREAAGAPGGEPAVVVPFLVAAGWHGGTTVPGSLGLDVPGPGGNGGRVRYAEPVGTHPRLVELVGELLLTRRAAEPRPAQAGAPTTPLAAATDALAERVAADGAVRLLEVVVRSDGEGYEVRHVADAGAPADRLEPLTGVAALERRARRTAAGAHRPLRTAAGLAPGWRVRASGREALADALVALYGPALTHWHLGERGVLESAGFPETAARQSGMYARLAQVGPAAVRAAVAAVCHGCPCLRRRLWRLDAADAGDARAGTNEGAGGTLVVPCPAPCPVLLTAVLERSGEPDAEPEVG